MTEMSLIIPLFVLAGACVVLWVIYRFFWTTLKVLVDAVTPGYLALKTGIQRVGGSFATVWKWMIGTSSARADHQQDGQCPSFVRGPAGVLCLLLAIAIVVVDFYLLKLAFEIVYHGMNQLPGSLDYKALTALGITAALLAAGAVWQDATLFTSRNALQLSKAGKFAMFFLSSAAGVLAVIRAYKLGGQSIPMACLIGGLTFFTSLVAAIVFSFAFQNLIHPFCQKYFHYIWTPVKFLMGIVAWLALAPVIVVMSASLLFPGFPIFLQSVRDLFIKNEEARLKEVDQKRREKYEKQRQEAEARGWIERRQQDEQAEAEWRYWQEMGYDAPPPPNQLVGDNGDGQHLPATQQVNQDEQQAEEEVVH